MSSKVTRHDQDRFERKSPKLATKSLEESHSLGSKQLQTPAKPHRSHRSIMVNSRNALIVAQLTWTVQQLRGSQA
jgi:hypothetical protein